MVRRFTAPDIGAGICDSQLHWEETLQAGKLALKPDAPVRNRFCGVVPGFLTSFTVGTNVTEYLWQEAEPQTGRPQVVPLFCYLAVVCGTTWIS